MEKNDFNREIGSRIRQIREYSKFTRENLAEMANNSVQFLADIETGRKSMTVKTLKKLSESLSISSDYILSGKSPDSGSPQQETPLYHMLETLTPNQKKDAEELLKIFIRAIHSNQ